MQEFDKELKDVYNYEFVISKFLYIIFLVLGLIVMLIPVREMKDTWYSFCLLTCGTNFYLASYMKIGQKGKMMGIYELLKWMPVSKSEIRRSRMQYLNQFTLKMGVCGIVLQQFGALAFAEWSVQNLTYACTVVLISWISGVIHLYIGGK